MSMAEFKENNASTIIDDKFSEPLFACPKCGGDMYRDLSLVFASYPPKYKYFCKNCGNIEIF